MTKILRRIILLKPGKQAMLSRRYRPRRCGSKAGAPTVYSNESVQTEQPTQQSSGPSSAGTLSPSTRPKCLSVQDVTEEDQQKLRDYVSNALNNFSKDFQWSLFETVVEGLTATVASLCEKCMEKGAAKWSFHPSQGWRWRKGKQNEVQHSHANGPQSSSAGYVLIVVSKGKLSLSG